MLISALVAIVVATFLWAAYRTVEQTLIRGGTDRAVSSSHQLAESLSGSIPQLLTSTRRLGADPRILAFIRNPGPETADAIRTVLVNGSTPQLVRRFEIWSTDGRLLLEIASERTGEAAGLRTYPPGQRPVKPGISELKAAGEFAFVEIDAEIHEGSSSGPLVGYFRRFGEISSNTLLNRLLGDEAQLKVGTPGGIWSDFSVVVPPPPAGGSGAPGEYRGRARDAVDRCHGEDRRRSLVRLDRISTAGRRRTRAGVPAADDPHRVPGRGGRRRPRPRRRRADHQAARCAEQRRRKNCRR